MKLNKIKEKLKQLKEIEKNCANLELKESINKKIDILENNKTVLK